MTTTFKTFVFAAMMTVFTTTAFANGNRHNNINRPAPAPAPMAVVHAPHHRHDCRCRECEDMRFRMKIERLHRETRGAVRGCHCPKCEDLRHHDHHPVGGHHNGMNHR